MLLRMRCQTLMVRSAPSRVSNHEASGEAAMIGVNPKMTSVAYFFKCLAKKSRLRGQAISALALS